MSVAVCQVGMSASSFRPFEQRSVDRTGVGLGLAFSRWGAEANDGGIYARNLPGRGYVFTVDLPRLAVPGRLPTSWRKRPTCGVTVSRFHKPVRRLWRESRLQSRGTSERQPERRDRG
jgi:hypothetical protein